MSGLIFSFLTLFVFLYHVLIRLMTRNGKIREGYCALWVGDLLFALLGTIITCSLYRFTLLPFLTLRNILILIALLLISLLIITLAPAGLNLFVFKRELPSEELSESEYRFNDTMEMVRNLFFVMLFLLPLFFSAEETFPAQFAFLSHFDNGELCSSFCLIAFLLLLPVCLRQSFFWLRNVTHTPSDAEKYLLKMAQAKKYYKNRNFRL